jgi:protein-S-isoprenylcysteine O-methyltransferase Ste14
MASALRLLWASWLIYWFWAARGAAPAKRSENSAVYFGRLFVLIAGCAFLMSDAELARVGYLGLRFVPASEALRALGLVVTAAGLVFSVWARVQGHRLVDTGPYAFVRNPIYTGILGGALGSALFIGECRGLVMLAALVVSFWKKIQREEKVLSEEFGGEFEKYSRRTKSLIPFVF